MNRNYYSLPYSQRRRYSNYSTADKDTSVISSTGGLSTNDSRNYTLKAYSSDPTKGTVTVSVVSEVAVGTVTYDNERGALSSSAGYPAGTVVEVYARSKQGYRFASWSHNLPQGSGRQTNPMRITMDRNVEIAANFEAAPSQTRTVNVRYDETMGQVTGSGFSQGSLTAQVGASVTLKATPKAGYEFVRWSGAPVDGKTTPSVTFQVNSNYDLVAVFRKTTVTSGTTSAADTPGSGHVVGGSGGGSTFGTSSNPVETPTEDSPNGFDLKAFLKKWWWAIAIAAYIIYKEKEGGSK